MSSGQAGGGSLLPHVDGSGAAAEHMNIDGAMAASSGGAAGLGGQQARSGGAPDRAAVSVCDLCNMRRADLRGPCGHKYHARCIYAMPITRCPVCDQEFPNTNDGGLLILPVEPFSNAGGATGESEDDPRTGARDGAETQTRTGRWHSFETMYAQRIVADFDAGTLPLCEGTKLGSLLCNILNCSPS
ncbi:unnamed protein product [Ectocarpus fasciculatus]